jgi:hypothetical protein
LICSAPPQLKAQIRVLVLQRGELVLELSRARHRADRDDEVLRGEGPLPADERGHSSPQIGRGECLVLLALHYGVRSVSAPPREVDAVLGLAAGAVATKLNLIEAEDVLSYGGH